LSASWALVAPLLETRLRSSLARWLLAVSLAAGLAAHPVSASLAHAQPAADTGVQVRKPRLMLVPESMVNSTAAQQYQQLTRQAQAKGVLNVDPRQVQRVRAIAARLIPHGARFNPAARDWAWEVNVIDAPTVNAFVMPGGKIMVYSGLIDRLQLTDDELAAVIGHEIAHALLEHGRARMSEQVLKSVGINFAAAYLGLGDIGYSVLANAANLAITLPYSRGHETDADLVGIEPRAAVSVWRKMAAASQGQPPQFLSTHPGHAQRIQEIERNLPRVLPLYQAARR
jgi:Zn-dependent protease with chaperone function